LRGEGGNYRFILRNKHTSNHPITRDHFTDPTFFRGGCVGDYSVGVVIWRELEGHAGLLAAGWFVSSMYLEYPFSLLPFIPSRVVLSVRCKGRAVVQGLEGAGSVVVDGSRV
jgi:hypothetical protein